MTDEDLGSFADFGGSGGDGDGDGDDASTGAPDRTGADVDAGRGYERTETADAASEAEDAFERVAYEGANGDGIGVLAVSEGLRIGEREDETRLRAYVTSANRSNVRLGRYLVAPYPDGESLFCKIVGLEYGQRFHGDDANEIHARRAMGERGIDEDDYTFIADLEPVSVLYRDGGELRRRMPDRVPKPETIVREADDDEEIKTALKIPDDGVFLGHLAVGGEKVRTGATPPTIDYRVTDDYATGDPLAFRHTLVAGGTGSGKTHTAKNVLRQYLSAERTYPVEAGSDREVRAAVVQFDPQDEYAQMHDDNPAADAEDERRWEREGVAYGGHDDTVAFVPTVGNATYTAAHHDAEQIPFTVPFSMVRSRPWLAASAGLNDNQYPALQTLLSRFFEQYGDGGTYAEFCSFLDDPALKEELDESGRIHEATYEAVFRRVRGMPDGVFDQDARPITDLVEQFVKPGRLSVVPTYHVSDSRATETVVLALASLLVDEKLSSDPRFPRIADTPLLVGMDEAHNFLADADTVQARQVVGKFTDAAKQGRKERLGLFLITQDPQDVAESVFKQVNTKVVLNLGDEDAIKSVNIPPALAEKVPYMETGQMVVYSPDNSEPVELLGLPTCLTRHGRG
ncbi:ATP-binding protein [Halarchaeum nitratireducens]|uniref:ATPase AAA n=1 Tax=Halarchaeum nitratireducens TaxID=489913 RepID=A0A830G7Y1_9EURY|nr:MULTISPECIES: ATP-binding protein [Halarchaeum]MBP2251449.1 DNA helicase HerA-like ATPase [Halarchaeum solikamskense]GGN07290.1 ATPase AAA [Halarchaeum nitratireducens]